MTSSRIICAPYRRLADSLGESRRAIGVRNILAKLRDDLIDLYRLTGRIGESGVRVEGQDRLLPDVLHALRIALISEALVLLARVRVSPNPAATAMKMCCATRCGLISKRRLTLSWRSFRLVRLANPWRMWPSRKATAPITARITAKWNTRLLSR